MHESFAGSSVAHFYSETLIKNTIGEMLNVSEKHLAWLFSRVSLVLGFAVFLHADFF